MLKLRYLTTTIAKFHENEAYHRNHASNDKEAETSSDYTKDRECSA